MNCENCKRKIEPGTTHEPLPVGECRVFDSKTNQLMYNSKQPSGWGKE